MGIVDWIFPRECVGCGKLGAYLCFECKKELYPHPELCPVCHKQSSGAALCAVCRVESGWALEGIGVGFAYEKLIKKLILKLKFYHKKDVGQFLAERLAFLVQLHPVWSMALEQKRLFLTFVPSHWYRHYFQKGYNQSQLLAKLLAAQLDCPCIALAKKSKSTVSQLKLSRDKRLKNLHLAFEALDLTMLPSGAIVLIIDDVTTTGATLNELATTLKNKRSDIHYWGLVVARHMGG